MSRKLRFERTLREIEGKLLGEQVKEGQED